MFVQHMLAVLKGDGKMATVMPHGVLFRGGEEREARTSLHRARLARSGHRPAGGPVLRHRHPGLRARDEQEGRRQRASTSSSSTPTANTAKARRKLPSRRRHLEDRARLPHAHERRTRRVPGYARRVPVEEIEGEDFNCNIRRYVDNAPPPEPHDVRAHLHGGVPKSEIDALEHFWSNYPDLRKRCFQPRSDPNVPANLYLDFTPEVTDRRALADIVNGDKSVAAAHEGFLKRSKPGGGSICQTSRPSRRATARRATSTLCAAACSPPSSRPSPEPSS